MFRERYKKDFGDLPDSMKDAPRLVIENPDNFLYHASGGNLYISQEILVFVESLREDYSLEVVWCFFNAKKNIENVLAGRKLKRHRSISLDVDPSMYMAGCDTFELLNPGPIDRVTMVSLESEEYQEVREEDFRETLKRLLHTVDVIGNVRSKTRKDRLSSPYIQDDPYTLYIPSNSKSFSELYGEGSPDGDRILSFGRLLSAIVSTDSGRRHNIESFRKDLQGFRERILQNIG